MNWKRFLRREAVDAEQQEELDFYVDVTTEEYVERGMNPEAARAAARQKLGNTTLIREEIYRMNTVAFAETAVRTARQTVRLVRSHPGFVRVSQSARCPPPQPSHVLKYSPYRYHRSQNQ